MSLVAELSRQYQLAIEERRRLQTEWCGITIAENMLACANDDVERAHGELFKAWVQAR